MSAITILESNPISGIGAVSFTLRNQPAENNLILAITCGFVGAPVLPFVDLRGIINSYSAQYGPLTQIAACRYSTSQGMSVTAYADGGAGSNHWIGYYYVIQVEGTTVAGAFDSNASYGPQNYNVQPYFPYHYNQNMVPFSGNGYYIYPTVTPSQNNALLIVPWQTSAIDNPGPQVTSINDYLNNSTTWTIDCSTTYINPDDSGTTPGSGASSHGDCLYVGHLNINNQTPIAYQPQIVFSGDGGPLNYFIQTYFTVFYSLLNSQPLVIINETAVGPTTVTAAATDTLPTFSENVSGVYIPYVNPNPPCTYSIQGFILPDTNIVYKPVLVVIDDDTVVAEFKQTLNYSPLNQ